MIETILYIAVSVVSVGSILGFATLRSSIRKAKAEATKAIAEAKSAEAKSEGDDLDNVDKVASIWQKLAEDLYKRYDKQASDIDLLKQKIAMLERNFCTVKDCPNRKSNEN